jgi:hypothetical protein
MTTRRSIKARRRLLLLLTLASLLLYVAFRSNRSGSAQNGDVEFQVKGAIQSVKYLWRNPENRSVNLLGHVLLSRLPSDHSTAPLDLPITIQPNGSDLVLQKINEVQASATLFKLLFASGEANVIVTVQPHLLGKALAIDIKANQPFIVSLNVGAWPAEAHARVVPVPYYSGKPVYLQTLDLFGNVYFDWQKSAATSIGLMEAFYGSLTNGTRNSVSESVVLALSDDIDDVVPGIPNPKSPFLQDLAGRVVIDIWTGAFNSIARGLNRLGDYGVRNCVALIHDWQRSGYDNALPAHYPANRTLGGDDGLRRVVEAGRRLGCYVGLHENYVDYYPDYEGFTDRAIARNSQGNLNLSWRNPTTGTQSYASKPTLFTYLAHEQSPEIQRRYQANASFIDVNSSVAPWWRADMDDSIPGAATFASFANSSAALWSVERQTHRGPVFGEGADHWFWSGLLDGVEAQFGAGTPINAGATAPLFVDFDLQKIHLLQVNHGMGYYERWAASGEDIEQTRIGDAYRMQEVLFGHAPYVGNLFWNVVPRVLLESGLVAPVAQRYGTATVSDIRYSVNGRWTGATAAVKARDWSRVQVRYANGETITANGKSNPLAVDGVTLPQYGWIAKGPDLLAYTAIRGGFIADYAETATSYFANARNQQDWILSAALANPRVVSFEELRKGLGRLTVQWQLLEEDSSASDLTVFVHYLRPGLDNDGIAFQSDHPFPLPARQWLPGEVVTDTFQISVPPSLPDGTYSVRIGLYSPRSGERFPLAGANDGQLRYILGSLTVAAGSSTLSFAQAPPATVIADQRMNAADNVVDFGSIRTDGMVSLSQDGDDWVLRTYPRWRGVTVQLDAHRFRPAPLQCDGAISIPPVRQVNGFWTISILGEKSCRWPK